MKAIDNDSKVNNQKIFLPFITKLSLEKADEINDKETYIIFQKIKMKKLSLSRFGLCFVDCAA